ncbi:hypothetical protein SPRG_17842 [Saprolegnia parasitica CBS 223.65]|uniref:Uncharacterized protein n=1 Tax=Saprolegnia parasitica (strain CBS 223.65) TaxID=695850 RepID=A0A067BQT2_SAPPC|nr:hypothetical protein SPRG_17842 [Saprolegnia parasitica CBS 223.65]KDO16661.1 hypothetical protein SPRG_17842 [Saprolegnia parasitica CBS 223.65]|eukprot:XP_012212630.1 hypothetical protein SPRG_17842 [Saprolegnia parasitica CBS 223.65]
MARDHVDAFLRDAGSHERVPRDHDLRCIAPRVCRQRCINEALVLSNVIQSRVVTTLEALAITNELASKRSARGTQLSCLTEVDLLERKTSYLRSALRETVDAIAKTIVNDDRAMYLARKAFLKELQTTGECMQEQHLGSPLQALARKSLAFEYDANDFRTSAFVDLPDLPGTPVEFAESLSPVSESPPNLLLASYPTPAAARA